MLFVAIGGVPLWIVLRTDGVVRRPRRESVPWLAAIVAAIAVGVVGGFALFRVVAG